MASLELQKEIDGFYKYYSENYKILETASDYFRTLIDSILLEQVQVQSVVSRVKNRDECIGKFRRKYQESLEKNNLPYEIKDHITDLIGVRVICLYEPDIAKIKKLGPRSCIWRSHGSSRLISDKTLAVDGICEA